MPNNARSAQIDQERGLEHVRSNDRHARRHAMRRHAHRSTLLHNHMSASPHFTCPVDAREEVGAQGFAQFLHSRLNHSRLPSRPSSHTQSAHLQPRSAQILFSMPTQHSMHGIMPSEPHIKCEEWSDDLPQHHLMSMPMQHYHTSYHGQEVTSATTSSFDLVPAPATTKRSAMDHQPVAHDDGVNPAAHMFPLHDDELPYNAASAASPANKWSLPHLFTDLSNLQPHDASATLLRAVESDSPAPTFFDGRTVTQQDIWKYETVSDSQWSSAGLSYEALAASSPESVDTYASEIVTPTTSTGNGFDHQHFMGNASLSSSGIVDLGHKKAVPLRVVEPVSYAHARADIIARSESPMFSIENANSTDATGLPSAAHRREMLTLSSRLQPFVPIHGVKDDRQIKDEQLIAWRDANLSYREIKRRGRFKEAESTLRGRYRALTKERKDRVRKPRWTEFDCQLLEAAVQRHFRSGAYGKSKDCQKVPWKKVTTWMKANGASYDFAPATCAKKWEEIQTYEGVAEAAGV